MALVLMMFLLLVAFASLLASPTLSASTPNGGFKAMLRHVDYAKGLTPNEHLQRAVQRTKMMVESHKPPHPNAFTNGVIGARNGEYFMNLTIGKPPTTYLALIDTDTDFMWTSCVPTQCNALGNNCSKLQTSSYDPKQSSTYKKLSCTSPQCKRATNTSCNKNDNSCTYKYQYSGGNPSLTRGDLATETFRSSSFNGKGSVAKFVFGCAHNVSDDFGDLGTGFVGLGRGIMSLVSQMNVSIFSHCFPSYDNPNKTGVLAFGDHAKKGSPETKVTTDMLHNPNHLSSYYLDLKGIKVNDNSLVLNSSSLQINSNDHTGGVVIDSGMSVSYLEKGAYNKLKEKLVSSIKLPQVRAPKDIALDLCFKLPKEINAENVNTYFPKIALTFGYRNRLADLVLPVGNVFRSYDDGRNHGEVSCLVMAAAPDSDGRSSLGNMQLQDTLVVYDLAANTVSFTPNTPCEGM